MKQKKRLILPAVFALLFILLIIAVKTADVGLSEGFESEVGLKSFNAEAHGFFGESETWYRVSEFTGYAAIACGGVFALLGAFQLIKRKSLFKVDREILLLGGLYVILGAIYVLFDKITVNCRPLSLYGESAYEPSFPSSHTVLAVAVAGSIIMLLPKYIKKNTLRQILSSLVCALGALTVTGRLLSGVHWFTDILGGMLLSAFLLSVFGLLIKKE